MKVKINSTKHGRFVVLTRKIMNESKPLLWGFFRRRQCVVPTWRGWLLILAVCAISAALLLRNAYAFLAMNAPLDGGILVVEGWGSDSLMASATNEFKKGHYEALFATGGPIDKGSLFTKYKTYAEMSVDTLEQMGVNPKSLHAIPAPSVRQDRTYATAIALKKWLGEHGMNTKKIEIITMGAHARRSRLLYEKVFGAGTRIGVISVRDEGIDPQHWWTNSNGFRSVVDEMVAYFYAKFLFRASAEHE